MIKMHNKLLNYLIIIPILSAAFISFLYLDAKSLWLDEAFSISFANLSWSDFWKIIFEEDANMSLYFVLLKIWVGMFGDSEFVVRSLSAIFAIGGVIMTYAIGLRLFNIRTGLMAGLVLSVNAFFIRYAQEARSYTLLLLLITCSMYLFIRVIENQQYKYYIALGVTNALVLYTHLFGFFILIAQAISLVFLPSRTILWKRMLTSAILTASLAVPLGVLVLTLKFYPLSWIPKTSLRAVYDLFLHFTGDGGELLLLYYLLPCFISFVFSVQVFIRLKRNQLVWRYALLLCWLFIPILSIYLVSMFKPAFIDRYMFASLPALVLLAVAGLSSFRFRILSLIATSLLILLSLHAVFYVYYPDEKENWRSATGFIVDNAKAGDAILFSYKPVQIPFEYYYRKMNHGNDILVSVFPFPFGTPVGVNILSNVLNPSESMLESVAERYDRLWVVLAYDGLDSRAIETEYVNLKNVFFEQINIKLYQRFSSVRSIIPKLPSIK